MSDDAIRFTAKLKGASDVARLLRRHPEKVGRTESHGCFRLANWDARTLLSVAWVGLPVFVEP